MKRNYVFVLLVGTLLIFTLTACGEKAPTGYPEYLDMSLDREIAAFDKIEGPSESGVKFVEYNKKDFYPNDVYIIELNYQLQKYEIRTSKEIKNEKATWISVNKSKEYKPSEQSFIYITSDNVLYLVSYRTQEIEGKLYKYITKMAVRDGDEFIYKVDNWSGDGVMVAEYCNMYYDYFNIYKEYKGQPTATPPATPEEINVKVPSYIDYSGKTEFSQFDRVLEADFDSAENPLSTAQQFVPEGATVYEATGSAGEGKIITYITTDGVCYRIDYDNDAKFGKTVNIYARRVSDHYTYIRMANEEGKELYLYHSCEESSARIILGYLNQWRKENGIEIPLPMGAPSGSVFKRAPAISNLSIK